jgi:hypothetical protein
MLEAFWGWINLNVTDKAFPETLEELVAAPRSTFAGFDRLEQIMRASLHTPSGRTMRLAMVERRRTAFRKALAPALVGRSASDARRIEAISHALYSVATWETLRDYAGMSGEEAGKAVAWALARLTGLSLEETRHD